MKIISITILVSIVCCFSSCNSGEIEDLQKKNRQLTTELEAALEQVDIARSDALTQRDAANFARIAADSCRAYAGELQQKLRDCQ